MPSEIPKRNSPCIGYCEHNDTLGICEGCFRTRDEIAVWKGLDEASQNKILQDLPLRRKKVLKGIYGDALKVRYRLVTG